MKKEVHCLLPDASLKMMRIKEHPFEVSEGNLIVDDELEMEGTLKLYENTGGSIYLSMEPANMNNLALVAEAEIEDLGENKLWVKRIFNEFGYDELWNPLVDQLQYFAKFYGFIFGFLDLRKRK